MQNRRQAKDAIQSIQNFFIKEGAMKIFIETLVMVAVGFSAGIGFTEEVKKPYSFTPDTDAKAEEVNANFDLLYKKVNDLLEFNRLLTIPDAVTVAPGGSGQVMVTWNGVKGATSYNLYLATESGVNATNYATKANGQLITRVKSPYTVTGLTGGKQYYFAVTSVTPSGESATSLEAGTIVNDWVKLLDNASYSGCNEEHKYPPLVTGSFTQVKAVYKSGYITCDKNINPASATNPNKWQLCILREPLAYAFELKKNDQYLVSQPGWTMISSACVKPSTPTGDIICNVNFSLASGDTLTPTWYENSRNTSCSDNGGQIFVEIWAK